MEAKNYRIGNYVQYNNGNKSVGKITTLVSDFVPGLDYCQIDYRRNKKHWLINVNPIPLTKEWLIKFGFGRSEEHELCNNFNEGVHFYYDWHFKKFWIDFHDDRTDYQKSFIIEYVHQLQNLYFSFTGEELEIKS